MRFGAKRVVLQEVAPFVGHFVAQPSLADLAVENGAITNVDDLLSKGEIVG
jgi:hypothetical protein